MFDISRLEKINDTLWEIPQQFRGDMRVPARIYASEEMLKDISQDDSLEQIVNVAALPGIVRFALAMPDIHEGYGFPIGGVAAFDAKNGVISPGGIGFDINCGVRLLVSEKTREDIAPYLENLGKKIYEEVPSGVGKRGQLILKGKEFDNVLMSGALEMRKKGYAEEGDLLRLESGGILDDADPNSVSDRAKKRGYDQLGTMGAGNHFVEVGYVETGFDEKESERLGLFKDMVTVLIHTGSRGLGHQIATDYIQTMLRAMPKYGISIPDRQLACAPFQSEEGQNYFKAMSAGANFAWANRQVITWEVRKAWKDVFGAEGGRLTVVYDVAHNLAKLEEYAINGKKRKLVVHRKGATRSFPDQPVLIPGSMGTSSYVLLGQELSLQESFGSSCHGAGRRMSRTHARKVIQGSAIRKQLKNKGIIINAGSIRGLAEEAPEAYKNVDDVVDIIHAAGFAKKVARLKPLAVIKG